MNIYKQYNDSAMAYLKEELLKKTDDTTVIARCIEELNTLYKNNQILVIEMLYKFKLNNPKTTYYYRGMVNNLLVLYTLGLSIVDPIKYNLPYELYKEADTDRVMFIDTSCRYTLLMKYIKKEYSDLDVFYGNYKKGDNRVGNAVRRKHFIITPKSIAFDNSRTYDEYTDKYIVIRLDKKSKYRRSREERKLNKKLRAKTTEEFAKVISMIHSVSVWDNNQDEIYESEIISLDNLIATREDIYEYLLERSIDKTTAIDIVKYIYTHSSNKKRNSSVWNNYVKLMKDKGCTDTYIEVFTTIDYIFGRGQAISQILSNDKGE